MYLPFAMFGDTFMVNGKENGKRIKIGYWTYFKGGRSWNTRQRGGTDIAKIG